TGGLDLEAPTDAIHAGIHRQASRALDEADAILFVIDGESGLTATHRGLPQMVRRGGQPVLGGAAKVDNTGRDPRSTAPVALGLGNVYPISAAHGRGVDALLDALAEKLPAAVRAAGSEGEEVAGAIRVALIGKPNAGKSSLLNRLTGAERSLVHSQPGTTTD